VIAVVLMRSHRSNTDMAVQTGLSRSFTWLIIFANFFLILNKDHGFIRQLA
jgi:phage gp29-like protein